MLLCQVNCPDISASVIYLGRRQVSMRYETGEEIASSFVFELAGLFSTNYCCMQPALLLVVLFFPNPETRNPLLLFLHKTLATSFLPLLHFFHYPSIHSVISRTQFYSLSRQSEYCLHYKDNSSGDGSWTMARRCNPNLALRARPSRCRE